MKCPHCGAEVKEGAGFCGSCGYDLSADNIMKTLD
ncbi:MAG: zinc-ribbon domain-containing protein, partial [Oscillospiraceae bacterium]